jgi:hypothetical protein
MGMFQDYRYLEEMHMKRDIFHSEFIKVFRGLSKKQTSRDSE